MTRTNADMIGQDSRPKLTIKLVSSLELLFRANVKLALVFTVADCQS